MGKSQGRIDPFPLGAHDSSDRLLIPEKLYGAGTRDRCSGHSLRPGHGPRNARSWSSYPVIPAVGKSSVGGTSCTRHLFRPRGLFASGKFDQYKRDIPVHDPGTGLPDPGPSDPRQERGGRWPSGGTLFRRLWVRNGQLIVNLIPELEFLIGKQAVRSRLAAARSAEPLPAGVSGGFLGRVRPPGAPACVVPRRPANGWMRQLLNCWSGLITDPGRAASDAGRSLPRQRSQFVSPAHADAWPRSASPERACGKLWLAAPSGSTTSGRARHRCIATASGIPPVLSRSCCRRRPGGNPFLRDPLPHGASRGRACSGSIRIRQVGSGTWLGFARRATPPMWWIFMVGKLKRLSRRDADRPLQHLACLGNVVQFATLTLVHGRLERRDPHGRSGEGPAPHGG